MILETFNSVIFRTFNQTKIYESNRFSWSNWNTATCRVGTSFPRDYRFGDYFGYEKYEEVMIFFSIQGISIGH